MNTEREGGEIRYLDQQAEQIGWFLDKGFGDETWWWQRMLVLDNPFIANKTSLVCYQLNCTGKGTIAIPVLEKEDSALDQILILPVSNTAQSAICASERECLHKVTSLAGNSKPW